MTAYISIISNLNLHLLLNLKLHADISKVIFQTRYLKGNALLAKSEQHIYYL